MWLSSALVNGLLRPSPSVAVVPSLAAKATITLPVGSIGARPRVMARVRLVRCMRASNGLLRQASRMTRPRPEAPDTAKVSDLSPIASFSTSASEASEASTGMAQFSPATSMPCPA